MLAGAKINLMLHVTGKRDDGYHLLQSLVMFAAFGDNVLLEPSQEFLLKTTGEFAGEVQGENLIATASWALADACNLAPHGTITLEKNLPVGAGFGGGSSDAATAMELLARHWNCNFSTSRLQHIATSIGSDIPACLQNAPLWMEGAGERITPIFIPFDVPVLLVNPRKPLATQSVYQNLTPPYAAPLSLPAGFVNLPDLVAFLYMSQNMLEAPAKKIEPEIDRVIRGISEIPGCLISRMSGSGASCFGIFLSLNACEYAEKLLRESHPEWWVKSTLLRRSHG